MRDKTEYHRLYMREYRAKNKVWLEAKQLERKRAWRLRNPDKERSRRLLALNGITLEEYDEMAKDQNYSCAVCSKSQEELGKRLTVDHDHDTGNVRGLLCNNCNSGIGRLGDTTDGLLMALSYLKNCYGEANERPQMAK